jgi:RHS repeat-associated protein
MRSACELVNGPPRVREGSYQYDVYGNVVNQQGSLYDERQFAGEQADPTGLTYLRARFHDPATGRLSSRDPHRLMARWICPGSAMALR